MVESVTPRAPEWKAAEPGSVLVFFVLTFAVTWSLWLAALAISRDGAAGYPPAGVGTLLFYLGVFAPAFVATWLTHRQEGSNGVRTLLGRLVRVRAGLRWYAFALGYMAAIKLTSALIHRLVIGAWPRFGTEPILLMVAAILLSTLVFSQAGEELGWRGYALPRLGARIGLGAASLVIGVMWAVWHLPLFFIPGIETTGQSFPLYALGVIALSVAIAWLYANTNGSLFLTMLMHSAINNTKDIVPTGARPPGNPFSLSASLMGWITAALLWICAAYLLLRLGRRADN
ncbi:MAG TPA: type II CAAX endopeptidase family protein [Gemmatimonadaceae bacterium]|nr:type II CAAX endopeptidase family protein [Gemmatimonadaceae bacterium]